MRNFAIAFTLGGLLLAACVAPGAPRAGSAKSGKAAPASDAGAGPCDKWTVRSPDEFVDCKTKCRDDKNTRDGSCNNDNNCLQASGIRMEQCMQRDCEDQKKGAQAAQCWKP
jgi:hypothetical protein